jgi:predicted nucleotidyltransferase
MKRTKVSKKEQLFDKRNTLEKIASMFYLYPDRDFTLSALAQEAGVSKSSVGEILEEMSDANFIKVERIGKKTMLIRANNESFEFLRWKIVYNLKSILYSGIIEELVNKFRNPRAVVLFGSYRWGQDAKDSDIDIAIETVDDVSYEVLEFSSGPVKEFEENMKRKVQVHIFNRKKIGLSFFNNVANGIVLYGFLEVDSVWKGQK